MFLQMKMTNEHKSCNGRTPAEKFNQLDSPLKRRISEPDHYGVSSLIAETVSLTGFTKSPSVPELKSNLIQASLKTTNGRIEKPEIDSNGANKSQWTKLRSAVQSVAVVRSELKKRKSNKLHREDSFLRRFSTRSYVRRSVGSAADSVDEGVAAYTLPEELEKENENKTIRSVLRPDSAVTFYWTCVVSVAVFYNLWVCIFREAFQEIQLRFQECWYCLDVLADLVYILDIVAQFRTGYLEQGLIVSEDKKLAFRYIQSKHFYLDIVSIIPTDLVQIKTGIHPMIRFNRFIKSYRILKFSQLLESRTAYPNLFRVASLMHVLFLGCHWFAGFYYMISQAENFKNKWTYPLPNGSYASVSRKYLMSLYWSTLTLTTIGDLHPPHENVEYIFVIVSYLIGVFVFATIVGQVGSVITNRNAQRQEFEKLVDSAKTYMRRHNVPTDMRNRVLRWYDYVWERGRVDGKWDINTLGLLPDKLKTELAIHVNLQTLRKVTIFQECQPEFLHDLLLKMKAYIFTPGDVICRYGEVAREMFIIADGVVEVISESGTVLTRMNTGDFFGEIGILNLDGGINRRSADVRSVGYSELFVLSREDVLSALTDHPEAEKILKEYGKKRLDAIRKLNTDPVVVNETKPICYQDDEEHLLLSPQERRQSLVRSCSTSCIGSLDERKNIAVELMRSLEGCHVTGQTTKSNLPSQIRELETLENSFNEEDEETEIPSIVIEPASPDKEKAPSNPITGHEPAHHSIAVETAVAAVKNILSEKWNEQESSLRGVIKVLENEADKREATISKLKYKVHSLEAEILRLKLEKHCESHSTQSVVRVNKFGETQVVSGEEYKDQNVV